MARRPYAIARQEWVGDALDDLTDRHKLAWKWDYARSRAIYIVGLVGEQAVPLDTRQAEQLVQRLYDELGVRWMPVPHPGGERELEPIRRQLGLQPGERFTSTPQPHVIPKAGGDDPADVRDVDDLPEL